MRAVGVDSPPTENGRRAPDARARERLRYQVLAWLHARVERDCQRVVSARGLHEHLGTSAEAVYAAIEQLSRSGLIRYVGAGPKICIAEAGLEPFRDGERRRSIRDRTA